MDTALKLLVIVFFPSLTVSQIKTCPTLHHSLEELESLPCIIDDFRQVKPTAKCTTVDLQCRSFADAPEEVSFKCTDQSSVLSVGIRKAQAVDEYALNENIIESNRTRITACRMDKDIASCVMYERDFGTDWTYEVKYSEAIDQPTSEFANNDSRLASTVYSCDCVRYGAFFRNQRKRCQEEVTWQLFRKNYVMFGCAAAVLFCVACKVGYDYAVSKGCRHRQEVADQQQ